MDERPYGPYKHGDLFRVHCVRGRGKTRSTRYRTFATRAEADAYIATFTIEGKGVTLMQAVDKFLDWKRDAKGCVGHTIENYEHRLWRLLGLPENGNRSVRYVERRGNELYQASVYGAGDTHINGLNVGRMWGAYCVKQKLLRTNPFAEVEAQGKRRKGSTKSRLTVNESRLLEAYCFEHGGPECVLTYGYMMLGKRASELARVLVRDLDDDGWLLRINEAKTEASVGTVPLNAALREMLLALTKDRPATASIFLDSYGDPMSRWAARDRVRTVTKAAIGRAVPPQELRRTFTDNAQRQGVALKTIAEMTGHTSTAVTTRSYMAREVVDAAAVERNFTVMQGGKR